MVVQIVNGRVTRKGGRDVTLRNENPGPAPGGLNERDGIPHDLRCVAYHRIGFRGQHHPQRAGRDGGEAHDDLAGVPAVANLAVLDADPGPQDVGEPAVALPYYGM